LKLFQGYMTGQIPDLKGALDKQNAEMNQAFMDAIKTISSSGHAVSQQDFIFSDWTPFQPYTK
jgi:roadblock/LC7 domain-containing protein